MLTNRLTIILWVLLTTMTLYAASPTGSIAYSDAHTRFTVVSDGVIRLEYAPDGTFTDNKSFLAVNREYPHSEYKVTSGKWIEITTPKMKLRYKKDSGPFTAENLSIASTGLTPSFIWKPGDRQEGNLKGTFRTLDKMDGELCTDGGLADCAEGDHIPIEDGILARDGWTLIDDSDGLLFDNNPEWEWVSPQKRQDGALDWYFMAYGHDYQAALKDFTLFAGKMPLPPRYAFGYWWSRYWMYSDKSLRDLSRKFKSIGMPLDVLVIDMDWHYTDEGRGGWTGWTWNKELFPDYTRLLSDLKSEGYHVTLNLHPADGVKHFEEKYAGIAKDMGMDPAEQKDIPWIGSDKRFVTSLFNNILTPMEDNGVAFWWLDWQQHLFDPVIPELKNTWWCNYMFFTHAEKFGKHRPLIYHRWSGLGNHRYQIGFSGDAIISWNSLDFQPYFNSTASNVLYGYWSHDIGGHMHGDIIPEMYVRWLQFGAMSPIMRTHSAKGNLRKEPWMFDDEVMEIILSTVRQRYDMAPYIYTMARRAYDDGVALCRPLYYCWPEKEESYSYRNQYMFGDNMLVAPVTSPMTDGVSEQEIWLPEGRWFELTTGSVVTGGEIMKRRFSLDEYPIYVTEGSILPFNTDSVMNLAGNDTPVVLNVYPGTSGSFSIYEDNGDDKEYATEWARTPINFSVENDRGIYEICKREGHYRDMTTKRKYIIKINNTFAPRQVKINGTPASYTYDGEDFAVLIDTGEKDCSEPRIVEVVWDTTADPTMLDGMKGRARRVAKALDKLRIWQPFITFRPALAALGSVAQAMEYATSDQPTVIGNFLTDYNRLEDILKEQGLDENTRKAFIRVAVYDYPQFLE